MIVKRTIALILALIMVLPVSFISALAHGPGVAMNDITNQSIHNALNQPLAETILVDGDYKDTGWDKDEWNTVNRRTGTWDSNAPDNVTFSYKYQLKMDGDYLYGVFALAQGATEVTIWLNDSEASAATDTIVIGLNGTSLTSYTINGKAPSYANGNDSKWPAEQFQIKAAKDTVEAGMTVVEFRAYRKAFASTNSITYFVAAKNGKNKLYYPVIATNGAEELKKPDEAWPANAIVVTRRDILDGNSDKHLPLNGASESQHNVIIDGRLEEPAWANLSDMRESDKTSHQFIDDGNKDTVGPLDLALKNDTATGYSTNHGDPHSYHTHTGGSYGCYSGLADGAYTRGFNGMKFKYDLRTDGTYLYGAVIVYDKKGATYHNMVGTDAVNGSTTYNQWLETYADTTYLAVNFYKEDGSRPVVGSLQVKSTSTSHLDSTYHIYQGDSAYSSQYTTAKENYENGERKAGGMRKNDSIVTFEFRIELKYLNDGTTAPSNIRLFLETYEGSAIDEGDNGGTYWRQYDTYASTDYLTLSSKTHAEPGYTLTGLTANGSLNDSEWSNLAATDYFVNSSYKNTGRDNGDVLSFRSEVIADHDYLYGSAVILLKSGLKKATPSNTSGEAYTATTYRLWLNDQGASSGFTEAISFYLGSGGDTRVMVSNGTDASKLGHTYYIKDANGNYAGYTYASNSATTMNATGEMQYGLEAVLRTVSASECNAKYRTAYPEMYSAISKGYVAVLEFKIPLQMARTDMPIYTSGNNSLVYNYHVSVEDGWNTGKGIATHVDDNNGNNEFRVFKPGSWDYSTSRYFYSENTFDTVEIDGMRTEFFWNDYSDYIGVNGSTGYYNPPQESNNTYAFGQTAYVGQNNFYGFAILDDEAVSGVTEYTLWINADPAQNGYTHRFHFFEQNGQFVCEAYDKNGTKLSFDKYTGVQIGANIINGRTSLEYMIDLDLFDPDRSGFEYTVSSLHEVNGEELGLYYPATDTYDKLFVTHINAAAVTPRAGMIYSYANRNKINGYATYFVFNPTSTANEYTVDCVADPTGADAKNEVLAAIKEGGFIYALYDTLFYDIYDKGTDAQQAIQASWKSVYGTGYIADCKAQFKIGAIVRFRGLDTASVVDPGNVSSIYDSVFGYELEALNVTFSVEKTDASNRNVNLPDNGVWYKTALKVDTLGYFYPEIIEVDGDLGDSGWDPNGWTEVREGSNGSLQSVEYQSNGAENYNYKYQMRTDGENVYFAFVLFDVDFAGTHGQGIQDTDGTYKFCPSVRVWVKSHNEEFKDAVSFTHLYDVRYGIPTDEAAQYANGNDYIETTLNIDKINIHGQTHAGQEWYLTNTDAKNIAGVPEDQIGVTQYSNSTKQVTYVNTQLRFSKHLGYSTGGYLYPWGGNADKTSGKGTTQNQNYSASLLFGETVEIMENTKNGANGNDEQWYAYTDTERYELAKEHGRWCYDDSTGNSMVEFKFNLDEIGCGNGEGFEYFVHGAFSGEKYDAPFTMFNPTVTNVPYGDQKGFTSYSLPFWNFDEITSLKYNSSTEYAHMLRNNYAPVASLGAKVTSNFNNTGKNAIRFGGLYTEDYIRRKAHEVTNNYKEGYDSADRVLNGANMDGITNYWDVAKVGIVFQFTQKLTKNSNGEVDLTLETAGVGSADSVGIYQWRQGSNFADYEKYVFYVTLNGLPEQLKDQKLSFRSYIDYYDVDGSPTYYDQIIERSWNQVNEGAVLPEQGADVGDGNQGGNQGGNGNPGTEIIKDYNGKVIAYIPLDDRPVNIDRAIYLAQSSGFEILMPPKEYYRTKINNADTAADDSAIGNPEKLYEWLQANENVADYFVISLDQLLSGGLVGSRDFAGVNKLPNAANDGAYYDPDLAFEEDVIDYLAGLVTRKEVVFFDSQMRLASTGQFNGFLSDSTTIDGKKVNHYTFLRSYFALEERPEVDVTASDALDRIFANYQKDANGNYILGENIYTADGKTLNVSANKYYTLGGYSITAEYLDRYLKSRERKLKLNEMLFDKGVVANSKLFYVGIDDSYPKASIHTAETAWLNYKGGHLANFEVFSGIDEIGLMSMAAFVTSCYGKVNAVVEYFGPGQDYAADDYGVEPLSNSINVHVEGVGANIISQSGTRNYMSILVYTRGGTKENPTAGAGSSYINALIDKAKSNIENGIPTCIIDGSTEHRELGNAIIASDLEISKLLGYSNWNTIANAAGIGISNAIARYSYLKNSDNITYESHVGFFKQISYSFLKDVGYTNKWKARWSDYNSTGDTYANRVLCTNDSDSFNTWKTTIMNRINGGSGSSANNASVMTKVGQYTTLGQIKIVGDLYWPWDRAFEASFDLGFKGATNMASGMTYTATAYSSGYGLDDETNCLTDGEMGNTFGWANSGWFAINADNQAGGITFNFSEKKNVSNVNLHLYNGTNGDGGIGAANYIYIYALNDNGVYEKVGEVNNLNRDNGSFYWATAYFEPVETTSIKVVGNIGKRTGTASDTQAAFIMINELQIW